MQTPHANIAWLQLRPVSSHQLFIVSHTVESCHGYIQYDWTYDKRCEECSVGTHVLVIVSERYTGQNCAAVMEVRCSSGSKLLDNSLDPCLCFQNTGMVSGIFPT